MNQQQIIKTKAAEDLESRMISKGLQTGAVSYDPSEDKVFLGDGRDYLDKDDFMVDMGALRKAKKFAESGEVDKLNKLKIYSSKYIQMKEVIKKLLAAKAASYAPLDIVARGMIGAAGPTAITDYEAIRRTGDLIEGILGQEHTNEDYQAINIADKVTKDAVRFEYITRTTARIIAQKNIGDDEEANPLRHVYKSDTKDIFAYGLQFISSMRDTIDTKIDVVTDFTKQVPDAILAAKNEDVVALLNAKAGGTNQGDWNAFTNGISDVNAASQVQVAEDAVKAYGRPLKTVMPTDTYNAYLKNLQGAVTRQPDNISGQSRSDASSKSGQLVGNPSVQYFIDDGLTPASYVLAGPDFMKWFQAMTVMTTFQNVKTPGKAEQRFWYDFAGFEVTLDVAGFKGLTVTT